MNCVKEVELKRGWACIVEGEHIPEGALVLTKRPEFLEAYVKQLKDVLI